MTKTIEENMVRLEDIIASIDKGELTLDESMKLYDEAIKISSECRDYLHTTEQRIVDISENK